MNEKEIVLEIMKEKKTTNAEVASALRITQATMWDRLNGKKKSMSIPILNELLRHLGYELVIMPRSKAGRIDGAYVVESDNK